jgi:hypothetical protein
MIKGLAERGTITMKMKHHLTNYWSNLPSFQAEKHLQENYIIFDSNISGGW